MRGWLKGRSQNIGPLGRASKGNHNATWREILFQAQSEGLLTDSQVVDLAGLNAKWIMLFLRSLFGSRK